jgi:uncharacterized protein YbgA (DUF1722 family)
MRGNADARLFFGHDSILKKTKIHQGGFVLGHLFPYFIKAIAQSSKKLNPLTVSSYLRGKCCIFFPVSLISFLQKK